MTKNCNGSGAKMTAEHTMLCGCNGLTYARNNVIGNNFSPLGGCALSFSHVQHKPDISKCVSGQTREETENPTDGATLAPQTQLPLTQQHPHTAQQPW